MSAETRRAIFVFAVLALLYFFGLDRTGMLGPDEPRYSAIGREMAASGDWVTPRLWGDPWFEKPPLLYWTTAVAANVGLSEDLAPRVPVAMAGFGFLIFFYFWVRREFGANEAFFALAILGSCAGWLAYSIIAVTDVPLSVTFGAALLLCVHPLQQRRAISAGVLLGLAVLAKGLVPLVLFVPVLWHQRRQWKWLAALLTVCFAVALPWYVLVTVRNGRAFFDEFIVKHHFQRFASDVLQHVRPPWFYIPVLLAGLIPWTPLLASVRKRIFEDARLRFLAGWLLWTLLFFSASKNKLPGYVLPMVPVIALLTGLSFAWVKRSHVPLVIAALLIAVVPFATAIVPQALIVGLSRSKLPPVDWTWVIAAVFAAGVCVMLEFQDRRADAMLLVAVALGITLFASKAKLMPVLDRNVSARYFYKRHANMMDGVCLQDVGRDQAYGLQYYAGKAIPVCATPDAKPRIIEIGNRLVYFN